MDVGKVSSGFLGSASALVGSRKLLKGKHTTILQWERFFGVLWWMR